MTTKSQLSDWVAASARAVSCLGKPGFAAALTDALRVIVPFEFTVIFAYHRDLKPIDLFDDFPATKRTVMVDDYQAGPYLLDPFYLHSQRPAKARLARLRDLAPDRFYQAEYFRNYYVQTGLAEEIGFIVDIGDEVSVVISAMRAHKVFSAREFRDLETLLPFVVATAQKQWGGLIGQAEVVEYILKGHSADATGRALGIASGTVRIHRRNIYAKLRVSSQGELFTRFMASISEPA
jgi:DNA-binding CsgD family transcriptional regulator